MSKDVRINLYCLPCTSFKLHARRSFTFNQGHPTVCFGKYIRSEGLRFLDLTAVKNKSFLWENWLHQILETYGMINFYRFRREKSVI